VKVVCVKGFLEQFVHSSLKGHTLGCAEAACEGVDGGVKDGNGSSI
jgi:hypothetical protein